METDLQRANFWKRIIAFIFDGILLVIVTVLAAAAASAVSGYNAAAEKLSAIYEKYESEYGVSFGITEEEYAAMLPEQQAEFDAAAKALNSDAEALEAYEKTIRLSLVVLSVSVFLGMMFLEFAVPLFLQDGRTLGKKIFGLALMRTDGCRVRPGNMLVRTLFGKYAMETLPPLLILVMLYFGTIGRMGVIVLALLAILQIALVTATRTNSCIHDLIAGTVEVDYLSQRIFRTPEEKAAFEKDAAKRHRDAYANDGGNAAFHTEQNNELSIDREETP